jgi:hypothetical protein
VEPLSTPLRQPPDDKPSPKLAYRAIFTGGVRPQLVQWRALRFRAPSEILHFARTSTLRKTGSSGFVEALPPTIWPLPLPELLPRANWWKWWMRCCGGCGGITRRSELADAAEGSRVSNLYLFVRPIFSGGLYIPRQLFTGRAAKTGFDMHRKPNEFVNRPERYGCGPF